MNDKIQNPKMDYYGEAYYTLSNTSCVRHLGEEYDLPRWRKIHRGASVVLPHMRPGTKFPLQRGSSLEFLSSVEQGISMFT